MMLYWFLNERNNKMLDPRSDVMNVWNHVFLIVCLISLSLDPLYFYIPYVGGKACMSTHNIATIAITYFRTITDSFYLINMLFKFRTAFVAPSSSVFGRGELVKDAREIATRYLKSDFIIDFAASLPLPQA
nr:cyclic nucleotide-gated ion channel 18-like [Ipomoea batatas]GMD72822.1 cyclic nucleotide-gated ion channel 18-like [Ipomoea batatas]